MVEATDTFFARQFAQVVNHYEWTSDHFKEIPSYSQYVLMGQMATAAGGPDKAYRDYVGGNLIGTPEEIIEKHQKRREMVGDYDIIANFSYGGMPYEEVYAQMKRFTDKVLPHIKG